MRTSLVEKMTDSYFHRAAEGEQKRPKEISKKKKFNVVRFWQI